VKRLLTFIVLSVLLFNWIGYQLFTAIAEQYANQVLMAKTGQNDLQESESVPVKMLSFHLSLYVKEMDSDDLLEFTTGPNQSAANHIMSNEVFSKIVNDLFPDHAKKENQQTSYKCFNGEYYSRQNNLFSKYPDSYTSGKKSDRYLLKIPIVFISPISHPPQHIG
jgi:hypothetical protein